MVAGKIMGDSLYSLKSLKEKLRGSLIFGSAQKSDYQVFLATKRVLEAEALLGKGKDNLAIKTLDKAGFFLDAASGNLEKAKKESEGSVTGLDLTKTRLENIKKLVSWLSTEAKENIKSKLEEVNTKVDALQKSLSS